MPDWNGIVPTTFSVASSMIQYCFGYDPMISVPLPAETRGFSAEWTSAPPATSARAPAQTPTASLRIMRPRLREDEIDFAPVLLGGRALGGPVGRVIQLIRHLRRPIAADVAVEQVALDRLTEPRG